MAKHTVSVAILDKIVLYNTQDLLLKLERVGFPANKYCSLVPKYGTGEPRRKEYCC